MTQTTEPPAEEQATLTIGEASRRVGVAVDTFRKWERRGKITGHRTEGGHRRFRESDVVALADEYAAR